MPDSSNNQQSILIALITEIVVGGFIAFGGFGQVFPRFLGAFEGIVDLETFKSLRTFSLLYFLFPACFFVIWYWLFRGNSLYMKEKNIDKEGWSVKADENTATVSLLDSKRQRWLKRVLLGLRSAVVQLYKKLTRLDIALKEIVAFLLVLLQASPLALFFVNEFLIEDIHYVYILLGHAGIGLLMLLHSSYFTYRDTEARKYPIAFLSHFRLNSIIYSLGIVLSIGTLAIMKPWLIYSPYFAKIIALSAFIYSIGALLTIYAFQFYWTGQDEKVRRINYQLLLFLILFSGVLGAFPMLYWEIWSSLTTVVVLTGIGFILYLLSFNYRRFENGKKLRAHIAKISVKFMPILLLLLAIGGFYLSLNKGYLYLNRNYFKNKLTASALVSNSKILPLFMFNEEYDLDKSAKEAQLVSFVSEINKTNHQYRSGKIQDRIEELFRKKNLVTTTFIDSICGDTLVRTPCYEELKDKFAMRSFFFKPYLEEGDFWESNLEGKKSLKEDLDAKVEQTFGKIENLNRFYEDVYDHIENSIVKGTLTRANKTIDTINNSILTEFYHPINYYGANLEYYSSQRKKAGELSSVLSSCVELTKFIQSKPHVDPILVDLLKTEAEKANSIAAQIREYRKRPLNADSVFLTSNQLFWSLKSLNAELKKIEQDLGRAKSKPDSDMVKKEIEALVKKKTKFYSRHMFDTLMQFNATKAEVVQLRAEALNLEKYKLDDYVSRYKRSQKIFLPYLTDSQRVGIFILLSSLIILVCAAYLNKKDFYGRDVTKKTDYDAPHRSLFIWSLVIFILLLPMVRRIDAELINPEHPTWIIMMNTWAAPTLDKFTGYPDDETEIVGIGAVEHEIEEENDNLEGLVKELKNLNTEQEKANILMDKLLNK
ncbi:MAG: hypothetical protein JXR03_03085 [Cyclobacteriaceae bacterium]